MPYQSYLQKTAPPWLQDQYGQAWLGGFGATIDDYVQQFISGVLAAFPGYAPPDALGIIGDEMGIDRGPTESDLSYAARLRGVWIAWKYAGTALGLLTALYWAGFPGAVIVQQNGLAYSLSASPIAGTDPVGLLVVTPTAALDVGLTSNVTPLRSIPSTTPWWAIDSNTDLCSRFQVLFPGPTFPSSFTTWATAVFTGAEDTVTVIWNNVFPDISYKVEPAPPTVTDGGGLVGVAVDGTSLTTAGATVLTTARFSGSVDLLAYQAGANPFADLHPPDLARLRNVVSRWKPAKASCLGAYVLAQGKFSAWPVSTMANMLGLPSTTVNVTGVI